MPINLRIAIFIVACVLALTVMQILHKEMIPVKYSLLWWIAIFVLMVLSLWPDFFLFFVNLMSFQTTSNMVIGVFIVILLFITMSLTVIVSSQKNKINVLIQEVSLLKEKIKEKSDE
ncbi:DUF2304 domain-containing protein [uncultured Holdemanella sp.]|uniref:DUF2304 domain-containing protein n=1 Tax=uncultured Holdemanella sp. TaxID=1763549 RepID=UPI0025E74680|nr:DUF2304 domain-containing protein [uncultured Holdemanella sp.]